MHEDGISRRELFRRSGGVGAALALPGLLQLESSAEAATELAPGDTGAAEMLAAANGSTTGMKVGPEIYQSIGVKPVINGRGTFTVLSGSLPLPEVRAAVDAGGQHFVFLDELQEAAGARLAQLTGAEWGLVTVGCSAAIQHGTAACIAGGNPDLHWRFPNLTGMPKDEVVIPKRSRNVYDAAVRATGARIIECDTIAEFEQALGPKTAMVYYFAGQAMDNSPLNLKAIAPIAQQRGVPILVDAAAEVLTIPNVHLQAGATLVCYSGGKCIRGPQTAGLLLGKKDLVKAAWVHSSPHHGYARALKIGKEQIMGMLMAVEQWTKRDYDGEMKIWGGWLDTIAKKVSTINGVVTKLNQPNEGLSNKTPTLRVLWDKKTFGFTGDAAVKALLEGEPRVALFYARGDASDPNLTGVSVTPYMLKPGEEKILADRLYAVISNPPDKDANKTPAPPVTDISGNWIVKIQFAASTGTHQFILRQQGNDLSGSHQGEFVNRDLNGMMDGDAVRLHSNVTEDRGDSMSYTFTGKLTGDTIAGNLDMGEYLGATFTATKKVNGGRGGRG